MKLIWHGHACFELKTSLGSVVFDPYCPGSVPGLSLPELRADAVICSHGHSDHCGSDAVRLSGANPAFSFTQIHTFHDGEGGKSAEETSAPSSRPRGCGSLTWAIWGIC